jgi:signal transduction histidine kinase
MADSELNNTISSEEFKKITEDLYKKNLELVHLNKEIARLNGELQGANEKLKSLDKLKSEFLSLASHQIRSPLTAIKGYSSMILEGDFGEVNEKAREAVDRIFKSSKNLAVMVEDFLNVSKIEQGGMKYEKANFDLTSIVEPMAKDLSVTAQAKGLVLDYSQDALNHIVFGDKEKIRQVILNFIDNSIKYTKAGSIKVSVTNHDGKVVFAVKDTGMGVTPEIKATLFQKFSRGEGGKMNTTGSGLGLYLAKEIIAAHEGRVDVESPGVNQGSTFFVELNEVK